MTDPSDQFTSRSVTHNHGARTGEPASDTQQSSRPYRLCVSVSRREGIKHLVLLWFSNSGGVFSVFLELALFPFWL